MGKGNVSSRGGALRSKIQWSRVFFIAIALFFLMEIVLSFGRKIVQERQTRAKLTRLESQLNRLEDQDRDLRKEQEALHSPEKVEELAREKLGYTKSHEFAIKVIKSPSETPDESLQPNREDKPMPASKRLWDKMKEAPPLKWLLR